MNDQTDDRAEAYRRAAKALHEVEGEIEIDRGATVSFGGDGGAYVAAWVWVADTDLDRDLAP